MLMRSLYFVLLGEGVSNGATIVMDLKNSLEAVNQFHSLRRRSSSQFQAINVAPSSTNVMFQCHCQKHKVSIMYHQKWTHDTAVTGPSVGLVVYLENDQKVASVWLANDNEKDIDCIVALVLHDANGEAILWLTHPYVSLKYF